MDRPVDSVTQGVESVFDYLSRSALVEGDDVCWTAYQTPDEPTTEVSVYRGAAGISFFLSDYCGSTGSAEAKRLSLGALSWSSRPER